MGSAGLLLLTSPFLVLQQRVGAILSEASKYVSRVLYVHLDLVSHLPIIINHANVKHHEELEQALHYQNCQNFLHAIYSSSTSICSNLDVRVLMSTLKYPQTIRRQIGTSTKIDIVLTDVQQKREDLKQYFLQNELERLRVHHLGVDLGDIGTYKSELDLEHLKKHRHKMYKNVVIGGTFDRLHNGHKILLSEALLRCLNRLTIGVTDGPMIQSKALWELIEPIEKRIKSLEEFLNEVDQSVSYEIEPIVDPFGPSTANPDLECIVVSEETVKGGLKVNEVRQKKGFKTLDMYTVNLVADDRPNKLQETKMSSSTARLRCLGKKLKFPKPRDHLSKMPYLVGLTGGIASGKSSIANTLKLLGAAVVNCDKLGHNVYAKDTKLFRTIVKEFGDDILDADGNIDRKRLGAKVFGVKEKLEKLNSLVWPEIKNLADEHINMYAAQGFTVVVLEAALLLEANWEDLVHEVWVAIIPKEEAIKRVMERDGLNEAQAFQRVNSQSSNETKVAHADVAFSTLWEPEFTKSQVVCAWDELQESLKNKVQ